MLHPFINSFQFVCESRTNVTHRKTYIRLSEHLLYWLKPLLLGYLIGYLPFSCVISFPVQWQSILSYIYLYIYLSARARCKRLVLDVVVYNITAGSLEKDCQLSPMHEMLRKPYTSVILWLTSGIVLVSFILNVPFSSFYISNCTEKILFHPGLV